MHKLSLKTRQLVWVDGLDKRPWNQQGCRATPETVNWNVENAQSLGFGLPQFGWTLNFLLRFFKVEVCGGIKIVLTCKEYSKDSWPSIFFQESIFLKAAQNLFHNLMNVLPGKLCFFVAGKVWKKLTIFMANIILLRRFHYDRGSSAIPACCYNPIATGMG